MKTSLSRTVVGGVLACLLVLLALPFTALPVAAAPQAGAPNIASIDAYISAQMQADHIPGVALGLVHNDQIVHLRGFGSADSTGRAVTPHTPFILASVSKSFTALAVMQLVEAGKIELDAPVQRYLPWFRVTDPVASARITVRHLLYQTSGLPDSACFTDQLTMTVEQFVRSLATVTLDRPVGSRFEYCSANYDVLGLIVQTVSGQPYGTYIEQHVFAALQMHDSFASEPEARRDGLAQGYRWLFGVPAPFDYYNPSDLPAGSLISSAEDLTHYLIAQMNGGRFGSATVLSPAGIATMHAPAVALIGGEGTGSYGMGWKNGTLAGIPAIWHDGAEPNVYTRLLIEPQTHWGVILLVNANNFIPVDGANSALTSLGAGVTRLLAGQAPQASLSLTTFYLIFDGVLAVLLALAIFPLLRLRRWSRRFGQRRHRFVRLGLRLTWEVALPVALLLGVPLFTSSALGTTNWYEILLLWPDVGSWILVISALLLLTGIIRAVLAIRVLRRTAAQTSQVMPPSPSPSLT